jgi:pimeloyl-ACP methyl ester carboxylesterase
MKTTVNHWGFGGWRPVPFGKVAGALQARRFLAAAMFLALPACSTVRVSTHSGRTAKEGLRAAEMLAGAQSPELAGFSRESVELLDRAKKLDARHANQRAGGLFLETAIDARDLLAKGGRSADERAALMQVHNMALARFAELWFGYRAKYGAPPAITVDSKPCTIVQAPDSDYQLDYFDKVISTASLESKGVVEKVRPGYGASLVGVRYRTPERENEMHFFGHRGLHVPVSMVLESPRRRSGASGLSVPVALYNPILRQSTSLGGRKTPLAADFSAPVEMLLVGHNETFWGLGGFFNARNRIKMSGIYMLEPYDPNRIPVILVHGLASVPIIWRDLLPALVAEPDIAKHYQFMVFAYPSSYTVAESARLFRHNLSELRKKYDPQGRDPLSNNMVVIGHSMGGVLTRLLVAQVGDTLWKFGSDVSFDQVKLKPKAREELRSLVFFNPDPAVKRAVFIATPHRGSEMARLSIAGFVSGLVKLPGNILNTTGRILEDPALSKLRRIYGKRLTSIQSLLPDSPVAQTLDVAPYKQGVFYHSIIGDRGKGDTPNSSDGIVEYWSSHQNGAASELIVPEDHSGTYKDPKSVVEIKRILRIHVGLTRDKGHPCPYYKNLGPDKDD